MERRNQSAVAPTIGLAKRNANQKKLVGLIAAGLFSGPLWGQVPDIGWQNNGAQLSDTVARLVKFHAKGPEAANAAKAKDAAKVDAKKAKIAAEEAAKLKAAADAAKAEADAQAAGPGAEGQAERGRSAVRCQPQRRAQRDQAVSRHESSRPICSWRPSCCCFSPSSSRRC